jgi:hypothetical protein
MVGVPGARIQNASPPSAALLAFGLAQVGLGLLAERSVSHWLERPDRVRVRVLVSRANGLTMPAYLWHMVPLVIVTVVAYPNGLLTQPDIGSGAWWAQRIIWVGALTVVLAVVLGVIRWCVPAAGIRRQHSAGPTASAPVSAPPTSVLRLLMLVLGIAGSAAGLGRLAVQGFAPDGSLDMTSTGVFALGVLMVSAARPASTRQIADGIARPAWKDVRDSK